MGSAYVVSRYSVCTCGVVQPQEEGWWADERGGQHSRAGGVKCRAAACAAVLAMCDRLTARGHVSLQIDQHVKTTCRHCQAASLVPYLHLCQYALVPDPVLPPAIARVQDVVRAACCAAHTALAAAAATCRCLLHLPRRHLEQEHAGPWAVVGGDGCDCNSLDVFSHAQLHWPHHGCIEPHVVRQQLGCGVGAVDGPLTEALVQAYGVVGVEVGEEVGRALAADELEAIY